MRSRLDPMSSLFPPLGRTIATAAMLAFVWTMAGSAQMISGALPPPPPRPVITNPTSAPPGAHGLHLSLSAFEAYDVNNRPNSQTSSTGSTTPLYRRDGFRTGGDATLSYNYNHQGQRTGFGANARASTHVYRFDERPLYTASGALHGSRPIGRTTNVNLAGTFSYSPYYNYNIIPGLSGAVNSAELAAAIEPDVNSALFSAELFRYGGSIGLSRRLTQRTSLHLAYDLHATDLRGAQRNLQHNGRFRVSRQMSQHLSLHTGYGYGSGTTGFGDRYETHNIDLGVDYHRALAISRRTTFGFSTGTMILADPESAAQTQFRRRLHFTGNARLNHEIGRSWSAGLNYQRGFEYVAGFTSPSLTDSVAASVGGSLTQNSALGFSARYLGGGSSAGTQARRHSGYHGNATLRMGLTTWLSGFANYGYYRYEFPDRSFLPAGFPARLSRSTIRVGASVGFPLLG